MNVGLLGELVGAVESIAADPPAAVVLAGRPGFFSAGADLKAVPSYGPDEQRAMVDGINRMALGVYALPCPVVGAITGHAIAGGLVLALCTDLRVVSSQGKYGLTEVRVGVPYPQAAIGVVQAELPPPPSGSSRSATSSTTRRPACDAGSSTRSPSPRPCCRAPRRSPAASQRCPPTSTRARST